MTKTQYARLANVGIQKGLANSIMKDIQSGTTLEEIRQALIGGHQDPVLLDHFDAVVGIASLLKYPKPKTTSTSSGRSINPS